ncbi:MAG: copper chaperone PCu(A)C [Proteobacteria bacterium]|nr:copper chaperone PCu(A)C [Pseudomonadota bacterium]
MRSSLAAWAFVAVLFGPMAAGALAEEFRTGNVVVSDPWMRATARANFVAPVYFDLTLEGVENEVLLRASSPDAGAVELRETGDFDGVLRSVRVDDVQVPPGRYRLDDGTIHLAVIQAPVLAEGSSITVVLEFQNAGELVIVVPILGLRAADPRPPL